MNVSSVLHWPWPRSIVPGSPVSPVLPVSTVPLVVLLIRRGDRGQVWSLINVLWGKDLLGLVRGHYMAIPRGHLMSHLVMKRIMLHMHLRWHASHLKKTASMIVVLKVFKNVLIYWYIWIQRSTYMSDLLIKLCLLLLQYFLSVQFFTFLDCLRELLDLLHHVCFIQHAGLWLPEEWIS